MLATLGPVDERGKQERMGEARVASAAAPPRLQPAIALRRGDGHTNRLPALLMRIEDESGPAGRGHCSGNQMSNRSLVLGDDRFVLSRQRGRRQRIVTSVDENRESPGGDARRDVDVDRKRRAPDLLEPEAVLLDEVERQSIRAGRPRSGDTKRELDLLAGRDRVRKRRSWPVPDDRVAEPVEPVECGPDPGGTDRTPGRRAGVLDDDVHDRRGACALLLGRPRQPPGRKRPGVDGMLADAVHDEGYSNQVSEPLLVRAARREEVERTPVWFMRQAGRSLPEYRAIREKHAFFEVAHTPELCAEVTLQPVRRHDVDAAVMFADIMTPVLGMGIDVRLVEGVGPVIDEPIRTMADVERLRVPDPEEAFAPVLEAVRLVRAALRQDQAVVGFCGGPFTVAGYLIEGKPSRDFALTKSLMLGEPAIWHALLAKLADTFAAYVAAKTRAGADVIQLFDSWVGALSPVHYREYVAPHSTRVLAAVEVPTIHFGTGTATLLEEMAVAGGDVIGLDWRIPLDTGWARVPDRAVQGNLDPAVLLAPWEIVETEARDILARAGGRPGHIFNLGHGVFPSVDPDTLTRLAALVREHRAATVQG